MVYYGRTNLWPSNIELQGLMVRVNTHRNHTVQLSLIVTVCSHKWEGSHRHSETTQDLYVNLDTASPMVLDQIRTKKMVKGAKNGQLTGKSPSLWITLIFTRPYFKYACDCSEQSRVQQVHVIVLNNHMHLKSHAHMVLPVSRDSNLTFHESWCRNGTGGSSLVI
jgi:hypothetical protein